MRRRARIALLGRERRRGNATTVSGGAKIVAVTADAVLAQASAAVGVVGGLAGLFALWRTELQRRSRRRDSPPELWDLIPGINYDFTEIVALGGCDSRWFLEQSRQRERAKLDVVAVQIVDDVLNGLVSDMRSDYDDAFAYSMAPGQHDSERTQRQIDCARQGQSNVACAITRMGELRRNAS